ncbi:anti-sigma factor antagonist [Kutzneria sp. NPDC052558]|uniref:anti-sigma factor antagonist n=1 Tax=Kutzneria sp. NPDC052558 TaxID=3364121 RepID=UPI0037C6325D
MTTSSTSAALAASTERIGAIAVVHLYGELDLATVDQVEFELAEAADGADALVVDLDGLAFLGSSGLSLLVGWSGRIATLRLVATRRQVLRPLQITELHRLFAIDTTVDEALAAVRRAELAPAQQQDQGQ